MATCHSCDLVKRRDRGEAPRWDRICRTPSWDIVHCYGTGVEGWLVVVARAHRATIAELTGPELEELGPLLGRSSTALHAVVGCEKTYVAQFAEAPGHAHVHFHVIPRSADLPDDRKGPAIFTRLGVPAGDAVSDARMDALADRLAPHFADVDVASGR
jgi:diadenosine tetraphosphate (Ap4A) HIT family hydrolase